MSSAFKKLLTKELGAAKYKNYFSEYQKLDEIRKKKGDKINTTVVFDDIYEELKQSGIECLQEKQKRLKETMMTVFHICRHYMFVLFTYLLAVVVIMLYGEFPMLNAISIVVISGAFLYKTYEFVINKYSYLDAYIIIAYKAALEKLLKENK